MPVLIDVQQNLDARLNLSRMATEQGYSPSHFQRLFTSAIGETPRAHIERLRLERAAYKLWISNESVLDVALSVGFRTHETFSRAFRRHFGVPPRSFRTSGSTVTRQPLHHRRASAPADCVLSEVRYPSLRELPLLAIRYIGPYDETPEPASPRDRHWRALIEWARTKRIAYQPIAICIFHDNPWLTPRDQQRADLCVPIRAVSPGNRSIRSTQIAAGIYAAITHMGPPSTRHRAFRHLADTVHASDEFSFPSEPAGAIAMSPFGHGHAGVHYTDVYLSVMRKD